jgi:enoyl-CoA hydratase/carnithine racemase
MGAGYRYGLTCNPRIATASDAMMALPRLEITGSLRGDEFLTFVNPDSRANAA